MGGSFVLKYCLPFFACGIWEVGREPRVQITLRLFLAGLVLLSGHFVSSSRGDIGYQFVTVGNPGNANDTAPPNAYGGVSYTYDIGTYDVTLNQYATFLNAVAQTDTFSLYNTNLGTDLNVAGISQSGSSGSYVYSVIGDGRRPVTYVSWFDAARMANWMHNGQPKGPEGNGTTETGAYTLNGDTSTGLETKNANASYWIPSESEWYKAAYYDPTIGGVNKYWTYATRSNTAPGNNANTPTVANEANYNNVVYSVTQTNGYSSSQNYLTDVGLFSNSASYYGTYDQSGDVYNWNDKIVNGDSRGVRGGYWNDGSSNLQSSNWGFYTPTLETNFIGFRLAVPEPSVAVSLIVGAGLLLGRRRRKQRTLSRK